MLETATNDPNLRRAYDRAHAQRAEYVTAALRRMHAVLWRPWPNANGASQLSQPLNCDCPA
ncbi:hypothetical protein [Aliiroseovarius sediminilitoris]|uniref:hypothetical protein n=1 Tax=Aliiroseovarius sediminilitoris TaxID=1173584 RepID=UPI00115FC45F|nr:hypothetical protein [Aliiroseovarius sediminilitoris]